MENIFDLEMLTIKNGKQLQELFKECNFDDVEEVKICLRYIRIKVSTFELRNCKKFDVTGNFFIDSLSLPNSETVIYPNKPLLNLYAPKAKKVNVKKSPLLGKLNLPSVEELIVEGSGVKMIIAPFLTKLEKLNNCTNLEVFIAPKYLDTTFVKSVKLRIFKCASEELKIGHVGDTQIEVLSNYKTLDIDRCLCSHIPELTKCTKFVCSTLSSKLDELCLPNCVHFKVCSMTKVKKLVLREATNIYIRIAKSLKTIIAPKCETINISQYRGKTLKLPCKEVYFYSSPHVETLNFPLCKRARIQNCHNLWEIVVPSCDDLSLSNVDNLEKIDTKMKLSWLRYDGKISIPKYKNLIIDKRCSKHLSFKNKESVYCKNLKCESIYCKNTTITLEYVTAVDVVIGSCNIINIKSCKIENLIIKGKHLVNIVGSTIQKANIESNVCNVEKSEIINARIFSITRVTVSCLRGEKLAFMTKGVFEGDEIETTILLLPCRTISMGHVNCDIIFLLRMPVRRLTTVKTNFGYTLTYMPSYCIISSYFGDLMQKSRYKYLAQKAFNHWYEKIL